MSHQNNLQESRRRKRYFGGILSFLSKRNLRTEKGEEDTGKRNLLFLSFKNKELEEKYNVMWRKVLLKKCIFHYLGILFIGSGIFTLHIVYYFAGTYESIVESLNGSPLFFINLFFLIFSCLVVIIWCICMLVFRIIIKSRRYSESRLIKWLMRSSCSFLVIEIALHVSNIPYGLFIMFFRDNNESIFLANWPVFSAVSTLFLGPRIKYQPIFAALNFSFHLFHVIYDTVILKSTCDLIIMIHIFHVFNILALYVVIHVLLYLNQWRERGDFHNRAVTQLKEIQLLEEIHLQNKLLQNLFPRFMIHTINVSSGGGKDFKYIKNFPSIVYLQSDFVSFTEYCLGVESPEEIILFLNEIFQRFDSIMDGSNCIEKLKTIGDAYCALANPVEDLYFSIMSMCLYAIRMQKEMRIYNDLYGKDMKMRIGLSCEEGTIVILGSSRITFDVFGKVLDEVEMLESSCPDGCIKTNSRVFFACMEESRKRNCMENLCKYFESSGDDGNFIILNSVTSVILSSAVSPVSPATPRRRRFSIMDSPGLDGSPVSSPSAMDRNPSNPVPCADEEIIEIIEEFPKVEKNDKILGFRRRSDDNGQEKQLMKDISRQQERVICFQFCCQCHKNRKKQREFSRKTSLEAESLLLRFRCNALYFIFFSVYFCVVMNAIVPVFETQKLFFNISITLLFCLTQLWLILLYAFFCWESGAVLSCLYVAHVSFVFVYYLSILIHDFRTYIAFRGMSLPMICILTFSIPLVHPFVKLIFALSMYIGARIFLSGVFSQEIENFVVSHEDKISVNIITILIFAAYSFYQRLSLIRSHINTRNLEKRYDMIRKREEINQKLTLSVLPQSVLDRIVKNCRTVPCGSDNRSQVGDRNQNINYVEPSQDFIFSNFYDCKESCVVFMKIARFRKFYRTDPKKSALEFLNQFFYDLDQILKLFPSLEKIKSVAETYMAYSKVGGRKGVLDCFFFSLLVLERVYGKESCSKKSGRKSPYGEVSVANQSSKIGLKVGMDNGTSIFALIGKTKFLYDIFGSNVNSAARLCVSCGEGGVHIRQELKDVLMEFEFLGSVNERFVDQGSTFLKGIGEVKTFWIKSVGNVMKEYFSLNLGPYLN